MGRRVKKAVYAYGSGEWEVQKEILFVYDGWNLIQEKEVSAAGDPLFDKFYVWGLDLSQSIQGAGGIGGLVCRVSGGEVRHYFYDANGNVGQLVNPADGAVTARYEYDPFGNAGFVDGVDAAENAFRFSTKYWDEETDLVYYGFRFYSSELGRWINRDPAEEEGGINLYRFVSNGSINDIDFNGLFILFGGPGFTNVRVPNDSSALTQGYISFEIKDHINHGTTGTISIGIEMLRTGKLRLDYEELSAALNEIGLSDAEKGAIRDAIKEEFRKKQTKLGKALTKKLLEHRKRTRFISSKNNPGKTNIKVNSQAKLFRITGRALVVVGLGVEVVSVVAAPEGEKLEESARATGRVAGGFAGGMYGIEVGAIGGPWGMAAGSVIFGIAGSIGGEGIIEIFCDDYEQ